MAQLSPDRLDAQLETCTAQLADLVSASDAGMRIPTCPEWTLRQLATHVGRAHRWAAEIVRTRAAEGIPFRAVPDGAYPAEPAEQDAWLRAGARRLTEAAGEAGTDIVWSFVGAVPATFWTRRMAHETLVHLADAQLAAGQQPAMDPAAAADAIDEWLSVMSGPNPGTADDRAAAMPVDAVMHVHATDGGLDGGEWQIRNTAGGIVVSAGGHGAGDVAITGPAQSLLLVLLGRLPQADPAVTVHGDGSILAAWLDVTRF